MLVATILPFAQGQAQGKANPPELFDDFNVTQPPHKNLPPKAIAGRNHAVNAHLDLLESDILTLNLYADVVYTAVRDRLVDNVKGNTIWFGHIEGEQNSEVTLTVRGKAMSGTIRIGEDLYEIRYSGNKTHLISKLDASKNPEHADIELLTKETAEGKPASSAPVLNDTITGSCTGWHVIDLMVVCTPQARSNASGVDGIEAKIVNAVAKANQAYQNSQIDMQLNIVHMAEIPYTETGDMTKSLDDLDGKTDGKMDAVHQWRDAYGADQVVLVSADTNYCGYAWIMLYPGSAFEQWAFGVVHDDSKYACLSTNTLAHELGHNQGNVHDRANSNVTGAYTYSYGYNTCTTSGIQTIMSYRCGGASLIPHFSNPNVLDGSEPTGISNSEDTARSMNNTKSYVAAWRTSTTVDTSTPNAPGDLFASALSDSEINLSWADNADNETGYRLERSVDNTNWTEFAVTGVNTTSFIDSGLAPLSDYQYRVRAYNSNGSYSYSNISSATTQQRVCVNNNPSLTMTPTTQYAAAGESLTYAIALKNNDSSVCNITTFTITAQNGTNIGSYSLSPGTSSNTTWNTSAPANDGSYSDSVSASAANHNTVTASSSVIVDSTAPSKPGNMSAALQRKSQVAIAWSASSDLGSGLTKLYTAKKWRHHYHNKQYRLNRQQELRHAHCTLSAKDYAGNTSAASSVSITIGSSTKGGGRRQEINKVVNAYKKRGLLSPFSFCSKNSLCFKCSC